MLSKSEKVAEEVIQVKSIKASNNKSKPPPSWQIKTSSLPPTPVSRIFSITKAWHTLMGSSYIVYSFWGEASAMNHGLADIFTSLHSVAYNFDCLTKKQTPLIMLLPNAT